MKQNKKQQTGERTPESDETKIYLTRDSTLQTPEEHRHDESIDPEKDDEISIPDHDWQHSNPHPADVRNTIGPKGNEEDTNGK